jgi:hypothetical protein
MMATSWATALDLYDRALLDFDDALDKNGETATFGFALPAHLGPLPPELHARAARIVEISARLERRVRAALADLAHEQAKLTRARKHRADRPRARFVDVES